MKDPRTNEPSLVYAEDSSHIYIDGVHIKGGRAVTAVRSSDIHVTNTTAEAVGVNRSLLEDFMTAWVAVATEQRLSDEAMHWLAEFQKSFVGSGLPDPTLGKKALEMLKQIALGMTANGAVIGLQEVARHVHL